MHRTADLLALGDREESGVMAITGIIGIGFVLGHMSGNLLIFRGAEAINAYCAFLHGPAGELLWIVRVVLIAAVILHCSRRVPTYAA